MTVAERLLAHPLVAGAAHGGPIIPGNCATARLMREAAAEIDRLQKAAPVSDD